MKSFILLSSAILFATALAPLHAHADDQNLMCRRNGCNSLNSNEHRPISGVSVSFNTTGPSDRRDKNTVAEASLGNDDTADIDINTDEAVDADNGAENDADAVADNSDDPGYSNDGGQWRPDNWANEPHNPYGGLYGPGT